MDYNDFSAPVVFGTGANIVECVDITINDDSLMEPMEEFTVSITRGPGTDSRVQLGPPSSITIIIIGL